MKDREKAIAMLREHARGVAQVNITQAHRDLITAMSALVQEFRVEFDVLGARYWENWQTRTHVSTMPGEPLPGNADEFVELNRVEFISRQGVISYDDDSL